IDDCTAFDLDHITEPPVMNGRRAELPPRVAEWMVRPFAVPGGFMIDPFAGSGALVSAATDCGMDAIGFEKQAS
uniref:DNA methyltransferase n=1 Tax=Enterococcus entomosocium TaxID=3034352 RepID=UPI002647D395